MESFRPKSAIAILLSLALFVGCRRAPRHLQGEELADADSSEGDTNNPSEGDINNSSEGDISKRDASPESVDIEKKPKKTCGNGIVEDFEECDGTDLNGESCYSLEGMSGELGCTYSCLYDLSKCYDIQTFYCGDGIIGGLEQCDGPNLGGNTCASLLGQEGDLSCTVFCYFDTTRCHYRDEPPYCGNGIQDSPGEECDKTDLAGESCTSLGYEGGTLSCQPDNCTFDTRLCFRCGNGTIEGLERCEQNDLNKQTCTTLGFTGGVLSCDVDTCDFDVSRCAVCGNGVVEIGENCDGDNLQGKTCNELGIGSGKLRCSAEQCLYDTSECDEDGGPYCGNGVTEAGEFCDGSDLLGASCESFGFDSGTLECNPVTCRYNTSLCQRQPASDVPCAECSQDNCSDPIGKCLNMPGCIDGLKCISDKCSGDPDSILTCGMDCLNGDMDSANLYISMFTCVVGNCGETCLGTF